MSVVSIKNVPSYDGGALLRAVAEHFEALGAAEELKPGLRVLIKPNLLTGRKPEQAVTTHHAVLSAVVAYVRSKGVTDIVIADSPSGPYLAPALKAVYGAAGYTSPDLAPLLNYDVTFRQVPAPEGCRNRYFNIITPVADADYIINLAKLKTHAMTTMTCGVKNLFGVIPGLQKPDMHFRCPALPDFAEMLCDLAATVKPDVTIADAVDSMEGNGPGGGTVRHTGVTFASRDPFALDVIAARFMGLDPEAAPHLAAAKRLGYLPEEPELSGDDFAPAAPPFKLPDTVSSLEFNSSLPKFLRSAFASFARRALRSYPKVGKERCVGCGKCAESCPQHIITLSGGKASMPRKGCISCFCCQEMCPAHAITAKRALKL